MKNMDKRIELDDTLNMIEKNLNGVQTLLDTVFMEYIDGFNKQQMILRLNSSHDRFISLMDMLVDYHTGAVNALQTCQKLSYDMTKAE